MSNHSHRATTCEGIAFRRRTSASRIDSYGVNASAEVRRAALEPIETIQPMTTPPDEQFVEIACEFFPLEVRNAYAELLQQQANGTLPSATDTCQRIAEQLAARRVTPRLALKLHLATMESVIATMGPASTKQVLTSGDVLVLELMTALADAYKRLDPPPALRAPRSKNWFAGSVK